MRFIRQTHGIYRGSGISFNRITSFSTGEVLGAKASYPEKDALS